jgi:hypothetical protein
LPHHPPSARAPCARGQPRARRVSRNPRGFAVWVVQKEAVPIVGASKVSEYWNGNRRVLLYAKIERGPDRPLGGTQAPRSATSQSIPINAPVPHLPASQVSHRSSAAADDRSQTVICFLETRRRVGYHEPRAVGAAFVSPALQRWETIPKTRRSPVGTALASDSNGGSRDLQVPEHRSRNHPAFSPGDISPLFPASPPNPAGLSRRRRSGC